MPILFWDKPAKKMSVEKWTDDYGFEDGPTGGYQSNMSDEDAARWKAKLTGTKLGFPQVEIRKSTGSQMVIIVNLGEGYNYKSYRARDEKYYGKTVQDIGNTYMTQEDIDYYGSPTKGINIHIATNGPIQLDFDDFAEMQQAIQEAKEFLENLT